MSEFLKKGISTPIAIGIILVLAVLVGGFTLWQYQEMQREEFIEMKMPEKIDTTDWETYRNEEYGFELKYPPNWVPKTPPLDVKFPFDDLVISFETDDTEKLIEERKIFPNYRSNLSIRFWSSISEQPEAKINNIEINTIEEFFEALPTVTKVGETTVDGKEAYEYIQGGYGQSYGILIKKGVQVYSLIFNRTWSKENLPKIEKKVLSTFRFIE